MASGYRSWRPFGVLGAAAGRDDLMMNAAGQISGLLTKSRPAAEAPIAAVAVEVVGGKR